MAVQKIRKLALNTKTSQKKNSYYVYIYIYIYIWKKPHHYPELSHLKWKTRFSQLRTTKSDLNGSRQRKSDPTQEKHSKSRNGPQNQKVWEPIQRQNVKVLLRGGRIRKKREHRQWKKKYQLFGLDALLELLPPGLKGVATDHLCLFRHVRILCILRKCNVKLIGFGDEYVGVSASGLPINRQNIIDTVHHSEIRFIAFTFWELTQREKNLLRQQKENKSKVKKWKKKTAAIAAHVLTYRDVYTYVSHVNFVGTRPSNLVILSDNGRAHPTQHQLTHAATRELIQMSHLNSSWSSTLPTTWKMCWHSNKK